MTKLFASLAAAILGLVAVAAQPAAAEDAAVGQVSRSDGAPQVQRADALLAATPGLPVLVDDLLITDARSRLEVTLADRSVVVIGPASQVRVVSLELAADDTRESSVLDVVSGILRATVTPGGSFEVQARSTVVSVRSTEFTVETAPDRVSALVLDGVVTVADPAQDVESVDLTRGLGIDIFVPPRESETGGQPGPPMPPDVHVWGPQRVAETVLRTRLP